MLLSRFACVAAKRWICESKDVATSYAVEFEGAEQHIMKVNTGVIATGSAGEMDLPDRQSVVWIGIGVTNDMLATRESDDGHDNAM